MSKPLKIHLERLPKRDAVARLRAAYTRLERGWRARRAIDQQPQATSKQKQEEVS
ncbi:MAG: hypothetical protein U9R15_09045 [Chloroflexota bacterium]|nr:hypothetical protein [Chloroflexota bacterium]